MTQLIPVHIGVQWAWHPTPNGPFSSSATSPNMGGSQAAYFPNEMVIRGFKWQSSVKTKNSEVLLHFQLAPTGSGLGEPGSMNLFSVHHITIADSQTIATPIMFEKDEGIVVPAGWVVWVYGEGVGPAHGAPVEVQTTLFVAPT